MKHPIIITLCIIALSYSLSTNAQKTPLDLNSKLEALSEDGIFRAADYYNWGASIIKGEDGLYHLFYSRWPRTNTFNGWLTKSEIAHATSQQPTGPWTYKETVLQGRGEGYWDAYTAHNPKIKYFDGKYYLYYIATNTGQEVFTKEDLCINKEKSIAPAVWKVLRSNQRSGVAVSSSLNGPWQRSNAPIIEPTGPISTIAVNPAISKGQDSTYYLIVKGDKPNEKRFIRNQAIATATSPTGPFTMQPNPVIGNLDTEDISMWYDEASGNFYAVFHAHSFIGLMQSADGLNWEKAEHYKITDKNIRMKEGTTLVTARMERPFVYIENNKAVVLLPSKKGMILTPSLSRWPIKRYCFTGHTCGTNSSYAS